MTDDQKNVLLFLDAFLSGKERHAALKGYAGVGKTWITAHWLERVTTDNPRLRVLVCAPTNKALDVLRSKCVRVNADFKTVDAFLGYRVKRNDDGDIEKQRHGRPLEYDLIVCDEGFMVKAAYHRELMAQRAKVLYVMDPAQLTPIGEDTTPAADAPCQYLMTQVVRQEEGSPIIGLATYLRQRVEDAGIFTLGDLRALHNGDNRVTYTPMSNVLDWACAAIDKGLDQCILAFDNWSVSRNNVMMHNRLYPDDELFGVGEIALVHETFEVNDDVMLLNGQTLPVLQSYRVDPIAGVDVYEVRVENPCTISADGERLDPHLTLKVARDPAELELVHKRLTNQIWEARRAGDIRGAERLAIERRPLNKLCPLRHNYSRTVHKAQGSTHDVAFLDWVSIYRSKEMRARLMYVGTTRPSQFLVIGVK